MKRVLAALLIFATLVSLLSTTALGISIDFEWDESGTWWNLLWTVQGDTLTISGTGEMHINYDYENEASMPYEWQYPGIKHIIIEEGVASVAPWAFEELDELQTVRIASTVTNIDRKAFYNCNTLTDVYFCGDAPEIGYRAFGNSDGEVIPNLTFYYIEGRAGWSDETWEEYTLATWSDAGMCGTTASWNFDKSTRTLTIYGNGRMTDYGYEESRPWEEYSNTITKIEIKEGITTIGDRAFYGIKSVQSIIIPSSIRTIGTNAFYGCKVLKTVHISDLASWCKITQKSPYAITWMTSHILYMDGKALENITIPEEITRINECAFECCIGLKSVIIPDSTSIKSIGAMAFEGCEDLTQVHLPQSLETIGYAAFRDCALTDVHIPDGVTAIDDQAFKNCKLKQIVIPEKLTNLGDYAFYCTTLEKVISLCTTPSYAMHCNYYSNSLGIPGKTIIYAIQGSGVWYLAYHCNFTFYTLDALDEAEIASYVMSEDIRHLIFSDMTYARIPKSYIGKTVSQWLDARAFSRDAKYGYDAEEMSQPIYSSSTLSRIDVYRSVGDWTILDLIDGAAGYAAAVFQKGDNIIIAYRGSEGGPTTVFNGEDWTVDMEFALFNYLNPDQFKAALQTYYKYENKGNVTLTGHSLGGALVTYVSTITKAPGYSFDGAAGHVIDLTYLYDAGSIDFTSTADMTVTNYTDPKSTTSTVADLIQHTNANLLPGVCYQTNSDCIKYSTFWTHQQYSNTTPSSNGKTIEFMPVAETHTPKSNWYASVDLEYLGLGLGATGALFSGGLMSAFKVTSNGFRLGRLIKTGNVYLGTGGDDEITVTGSIKGFWNLTATVTRNVMYGGDGQDSLLGGCASDILIPGSLEGDLLCGGSGNDDYLIDCNKSGYVYIADMSGKDRIVLLNAEDLSSSAITSVGTSDNNEWQIFDISGKIRIYILRKTKHSFTVIDANERKLCTVDAYGKVNASRAVSATEEDGSKDICISGDGRLDIYGSDGTLVASYETNQYGQYFEEFGIVSVVQGEDSNFLTATIYDTYYAEVVGSDSVDILLVGTDDDGYVQKTTSAEGIDLSAGTASVDFVEQTVSQSDNELNVEETEKTTRVAISQEEATIRVSDHVDLSAVAYFADDTETTDIYWISADPTIVQCSYDAEGNCVLSASKEGEVEIYAVAKDSGYTATCKVNAYCVHDYACETQEPTCTEEGADVYTCTLCGDSYRENIQPATGHSYDNWICTVCGEPDPNAPIEEDTLKFKSASLTLESDISMNFYVRDTILEGWSDPYVVFQKALYDADGNVTGYETETVNDFTLKSDSSGVACHAFRFTGVTSREMGSSITATLYAYKDGELYVGATIEYSVLKYASNMLSKSSDASLQTLLVDLLNYGAASQTYFNYNTANLPNAGLTEEQKAFATADTPTVESHTALIKNDGATVSFKSASLMLEEKVTINYYLNLDNYDGAVEDLELHVNYTDASGNESVKVIDSSEFEYKLYSGVYRYVANFSELYAFQMRDVCTAEVFSKATGERISNTVVYSIESYVAGKMNDSDENLIRLICEMMKYGDSAKAFFTQSQ